MIFVDAMSAVLDGAPVRRAAWGARRAIRLMVTPANGVDEFVMVYDLTNKGDVPPFPYVLKGDDARADDWVRL